MIDRRSSKQALSVGHNQHAGCAGCGLRAFFGIFFFAGAAMLYFMVIQPFAGFFAAQAWEETPCTIISSEVEEHDGDDGTTYSVAITFGYEWNGQQHTSDRRDFFDIGSSSGRGSKQDFVDAHPPGHQTICYVDPDDPSEAVLFRDWSLGMLWGLFPLPFLAVGTFGLLFGNRLMSTGSRAVSDSDETASGDSSQQGLVPQRGAEGPVVLKASVSPIGMFCAAIGVCLFWNGIVSIFVYQVVDGFRRGNPEWFLTIFMIPFVVIGAGLVLWVGYAFLSLFNPRPELTLDRGTLALGDVGQVSWRFKGSVRSIRNFKLSVIGTESATYRRGTDTHTDVEKFFEHVFYEGDHPSHIVEGTAEFEIPPDSMHTFDAGNNEIAWSIHVAGDIPLRPDVNADFPIIVTPHERFSEA